MCAELNGSIISAALAGIVEARHTYASWTRNVGYFSWAPEYLMTVSVAQAIWEWCAPLTVWPEFRLNDALREAAPPHRRAAVAAESHRRADLLLYDASARPHAIIELKRNVEGWGRIADDVERMRQVLAAPGSSFQLGMVAFNSTLIGNGRTKGGAVLTERLGRLADQADAIRLRGWRCRMTSSRVGFDGHEHWSAAALILEKAPARQPRLGGREPSCASRTAQVPSAS